MYFCGYKRGFAATPEKQVSLYQNIIMEKAKKVMVEEMGIDIDRFTYGLGGYFNIRRKTITVVNFEKR